MIPDDFRSSSFYGLRSQDSQDYCNPKIYSIVYCIYISSGYDE